MSTAPHHRQRVAAQAAALGPEIEKVSDYITSPDFASLDPIERMLLSGQIAAMRNYHFALRARLHHWAGAAGSDPLQANDSAPPNRA